VLKIGRKPFWQFQKNIKNNLKIIATPQPEKIVAELLAKELISYLGKGKVLLLLAGGSAVSIYPLLLKHLSKLGSLKNLSVSVGDERWDKNPLHRNSNWQEINKTGLLELVRIEGGQVYQILKGKSFEETAKDYQKFLERNISDNSYIISMQGIGVDGHTAGIFPSSRKVFTENYLKNVLVSAYQLGPKDSPKRITISPKFFQKINKIYLFAKGAEKLPLLKKLIKSASAKQSFIYKYPALLALRRNCLLITDQDLN